MQSKERRATIMDLEVTTKTEVKLQHSLWMKTQECLVCQIFDIYSEQHFDWSLCSVSPSAPLSCYLTFSTSLPIAQPSHSLWRMPWRAAGFVWSLFVCRTEAVS